MVFRTHYTLYKIGKISSYVLIGLIALTGFILLFILKKFWWISLVVTIPSCSLLYLAAYIFEQLMLDIDELNEELSRLRNKKDTTSVNSYEYYVSKDNLRDEISSLREELAMLQETKHTKKKVVEETLDEKEEMDQSAKLDDNRDIVLGDKVKLVATTEKDGVLLKKGKVGVVDNILRGFSGVTYVVVFSKDKKEYSFGKNEIILTN